MFLDVKSFAKAVRSDIRKRAEKLPHPPKMKIFVTQHDPATDSYLRSKVKVAAETGIEAEVVDVSDKSIWYVERALENAGCPSILQLPLREDLRDSERVLLQRLGSWDADGINGLSSRTPATALGIAKYIEQLVKEGRVKTGCKVVVVNRSKLIGKPLIPLLLAQDFCVSVLHSKVNETVKEYELKTANVIVTGVGIADFLKINDVKPGVVIIDAGITRGETGITGDCAKSLAEVADVTPVPGGVGQLTTTYLMHNVLDYYC